MPIEVHKLSNDPTAAWTAISIEKRQCVIKVAMRSPNGEIPNNKVRIVCMSDTHNLTRYIKFDIPDGDIFIHAGDFTKRGRVEEIQEFNNWIGRFIEVSCSIGMILFFFVNRATTASTQNCYSWESRA